MEIGTKLGHYEILDRLGAGGMGEVYRAKDTTLDRHVAIKVLPEDFADDAAHLARFEREAKLLASLNHPNIATIHGFDESDGVRFIAMELVEGDSLADRIQSKGRMDVDEALETARQIALALEAAHEAGVIHRDLKPANVQVAAAGAVKVLDFGLAKAHEPTGEAAADLTMSPTVAAPTQMGVILGTAAYMSPEQARGKPLDKRTDIWSFGCVLYEMLTGRTAFVGETVTDVLAAIVKEEPDWSLVPTTTPALVSRLLQRCLRKSPADRLQHIGDARIEIVDVLNDPGGDISLHASSGEAATAAWRQVILVAGGAAAATALIVWILMREVPQPPKSPMRLEARLAEVGIGQEAEDFAVSPDGTHIAYIAQEPSGTGGTICSVA